MAEEGGGGVPEEGPATGGHSAAATSTTAVEPADGVAYPITLGATFTRPSAREAYHLLQYTSFKPASLGEEEPGLLQYAKGGTVLAEFRNRTKAGEVVRLQGHYAELKETECVLIFDGTSFRLERLAGSCRRMNVVRSARSSSAPAAAVAAAAAAASSVSSTSVTPAASTHAQKSDAAAASSTPATTSASASPPSTVSHKRPRSTVASKSVAPSVGNGSGVKRPRATGAAVQHEDSEEEESVMELEDEDPDKSGYEDVLSLASELEMNLDEGEQGLSGKSPAISVNQQEEATKSLFSEDEEDQEPIPPVASADVLPPLSPSTRDAALAGKSLPAASNPPLDQDSDSESESDSGSGSDSDSESESDSGSSGSDSDSGSD